MSRPPIDAYTDGACSGNPGPGGWGAYLVQNGETRELKGGEPATTNNRMEMLAAISALEFIRPGATVRLFTDSVYLKDGITKWIHGWKKNNWIKSSDRKPVKNVDLWQRLDAALEKHSEVSWHWVKGHAGHPENEIADALARAGMEPFKTK